MRNVLAALVLFAAHAPAVEDIKYVRKTPFLNNAKAVVTHTIDDTTKFVAPCIDAMDRFGIKATIFVSTAREGIAGLWPRLEQAWLNGHEIGSHSRTHQCKWPDTEQFCNGAYSDPEVAGSRDDILKNTTQPYVWSWCYPCGNCASQEAIQKRLAAAGYILGRNYAGEAEDKHNLPNLQTWAANPFDAAYTQVVQKKGGIAKSGRTNVAELNAKFDEVYNKGGIYNFMSHPQWLDYEPGNFYEKHLEHIARRKDVWYVPMGPLYTYKEVLEKTKVTRERTRKGLIRFLVSNELDPKVYHNAVTLEFLAPKGQTPEVYVRGRMVPEMTEGVTDRWDREYYRQEGARIYVTVKPEATVEFR